MFNNLGLATRVLWIEQMIFRHKTYGVDGSLLRNIVHRGLHLTVLASSCPSRAKRANSYLSYDNNNIKLLFYFNFILLMYHHFSKLSYNLKNKDG